MLLAGEIIGHWFPTKRGVAMGLCTAGYPLSAATTSAVAGMFVGTVGYSAYYIAIAVIAVIVGIVVIVFVRDFPEEKVVTRITILHLMVKKQKLSIRQRLST